MFARKWRGRRATRAATRTARMRCSLTCAVSNGPPPAATPQRRRWSPRSARSAAAGGKRWLVVCGIDGRGHRYEGTFVTVLAQGKVIPELPICWGGPKFIGVFNEGEQPTTTAERNDPSYC